MVEGQDYDFIAHVSGHPIRWPCGVPIYLALNGPVPPAAAGTLTSVMAELRTETGLDLRRDDHPPGGARSITVRFAPAGSTVGDLRVGRDPELGIGGPIWSLTTGVIERGEVLIRDDTPLSDPLTPTGRRVMMHEIGHALGLGHAAAGLPEVMGPTTSADDTDTLGEGDRAALLTVGCPIK